MHSCLSGCVNTAWNTNGMHERYIFACREQEQNVVSFVLGKSRTMSSSPPPLIGEGSATRMQPQQHSNGRGSGLTLSFFAEEHCDVRLEFASISGSVCLPRAHLSGFSRVGYSHLGCMWKVLGGSAVCSLLLLPKLLPPIHLRIFYIPCHSSRFKGSSSGIILEH
jgi:hypothetical protein